MTKKEFKNNYSAARAVLKGVIKAFSNDWDSERKKIAIESAFKVASDLGVRYSIVENNTHFIYPIKEFKWAISHNHKGY